MAQVVIVTGGAGGIGSAICRSLAGEGMKIVVSDFAEAARKSLADEIVKDGGAAIFQKVDVGDKASAGQMVKKTLERYSQIDFLINGAGVISRASVQEMTEEDWDRVLRINLRGTFLCSQAVARPKYPELDMEKNGVRIMLLKPEDTDRLGKEYPQLREEFLLRR